MLRSTKWVVAAAASLMLSVGCTKSGDQSGSETAPPATSTTPSTPTGGEMDTTGTGTGTDTTGTGTDGTGGTGATGTDITGAPADNSGSVGGQTGTGSTPSTGGYRTMPKADAGM